MSGFSGAIAPGVLAPPYVATITTGQWSGSGDDYYITVSASNVTADAILIPHYDQPSSEYFNGPVWCVPGSGSFTIHTSAIPSDTVTVLVQFVSVLGEAQYQVLADVYSTSQAVAKADIVDNLAIDDATGDKVAGQHEVYQLNNKTVENFSQGQKIALQKTTDGRLAVYNNGTWIGTIVFDSLPT